METGIQKLKVSGPAACVIKFFIDGANVWGVDFRDNEGASNKLRSSTGLLVNWFTPIGPMNFSLAHPITKGRDDRTQIFQFNIGTTF